MYNEAIAISDQAIIINRSFTDNVTIIVRNPGTNADIIVWIGATSAEGPNAQAITVKAGKAVTLVPSSLGDATNTFLLVLNASAVNTASFQVEIIG